MVSGSAASPTNSRDTLVLKLDDDAPHLVEVGDTLVHFKSDHEDATQDSRQKPRFLSRHIQNNAILSQQLHYDAHIRVRR
ncbi:hypothetical protein MRX96_045040 [Rhipicephalus microplus]